MTEAFPNGASTEEISFKLTSQLLPSFAHSKASILYPEPSLEYSVSRISIQQNLQEEDQRWLEKALASPIKDSSLKGSSINTTQASLKLTPTRTSKSRPLSSNRGVEAQNSKKKLSFRLFEFDEGKLGTKNGIVHGEQAKGWVSERRRHSIYLAKENKITLLNNYSSLKTAKSNSHKKETNNAISLLGLKQGIRIQQIQLKEDQQRQKTYLKRMIQARSSSTHFSESHPFTLPLRSYRRPLQPHPLMIC